MGLFVQFYLQESSLFAEPRAGNFLHRHFVKCLPIFKLFIQVLWPAHHVRDLKLWSEVYLGSLGNLSDYPPDTTELLIDAKNSLTKTRSYDDLICVSGHNGSLTRRSSDPNMTADMHAAAAAAGPAIGFNCIGGGVHESTDPSEDGILSEVNENEIGQLCQSATPDGTTGEIRKCDCVSQKNADHIVNVEENTCHCRMAAVTSQHLELKVEDDSVLDPSAVTDKQNKKHLLLVDSGKSIDMVDGKMNMCRNDYMLHSHNLNGFFFVLFK